MNSLLLFGQTSNDMYPVDVSNTVTDGVILGMIVLFFGIILIAYAVISYLLSRIFRKAGIPAWKAWVPIYSIWTTLELGGQAGWISLLLLAPPVAMLLAAVPDANTAAVLLFFSTYLLSLVATVYLYIAMYKIGLHFGKEGYFVLWAIFLPIVWYTWLAFDQSTWKQSAIMAKFEQPNNKNDDSHPSAPTV